MLTIQEWSLKLQTKILHGLLLFLGGSDRLSWVRGRCMVLRVGELPVTVFDYKQTGLHI